MIKKVILTFLPDFCHFVYICFANKRVHQQRPSMSQSNKVVVFGSWINLCLLTNQWFAYKDGHVLLSTGIICRNYEWKIPTNNTQITRVCLEHAHKRKHDTNTEKSLLRQSNSRTRTNCRSKHRIKNIRSVLPCSAPVVSVCVGCVLLFPPSVSVVAVSVRTFQLINCIVNF